MRADRFIRRLGVIIAAITLAHSAAAMAAVSIDSYTFGALEARPIGPAVMSGRIMAIDAVVADPRIVYVGTASGGIWKSTNRGTTFKPIFDKYTQSIGAIAIDQSHPDTVWVGTGESCVRNSVSVGTGLYRTTDGGETWEFIGFKDSERISRIVIDPSNTSIVYVAILGHLWNANEERGLYKTTDCGKTWTRILYVDQNTGCADVAIDLKNPGTLYAGMWEFRRLPYFFTSGGKGSGLYKTTDGGTTWTRLSKGLPSGELGRIGVAVAPSAPSHVYAVVESEKNALYRSVDYGQSWTSVSTSINVQMRPFYFAHVAVDPLDSNRVYKPGLTLSVSDDGGEAFTTPFRGGGNIHPDHHALWINPNDTKEILIGTDGGVYASHDKGNTWNFLQNLPVSQFYHVACDDDRPYNVYGGIQDNGSWYGPSRSPNGIENRDWQPLLGGDGFYVLPDRADHDVIYAEYQGGNLIRLHKSTRETKDIRPFPKEGEPELRYNWNTPVAQSPNNPKAIYIGSQYLYRSTDKGDSWQRISGDLTTNDPKKLRQDESGGLTIDNSTAENHCTIITINESPRDSSVIWAGTDDGNLQVTQDGGKSWTNTVAKITGLPKCTWCSSVEPSHHDRATAYATFDGHRTGDMKPHVYKTTDFGKTWTSIASDSIKGYAHVIREDLVNPGLLFLGTEFGLYVSVDGGAQWAHFTGKLPNVGVFDMVIQPRESDLILATHGRGIMIIDDITPIRQLTPKVLESDAHMLSARPTPITIPSYEQNFPGDEVFAGDNPPEVAAITYYLKQRHMFGDLKVEVFDANGKLLNTLPGGKRRGINRVLWFMRMKPPKVPPSPELAGGALFGPMVPAGTYTVKVERPSDTLIGQVQVVLDPSLPHSAADRELQQKTVWKLYEMQERLAFINDAIVGVRDDAKSRSDSLKKGDALEKTLTAFSRRLDSLHKTLVATKEGFLTGEVQLRERVVDLYGSVSGYGGRPTESQLSRMDVLEKNIEKANTDFEAMTSKDLAQINTQLQTKNLTPIKVMTKEEFDKKK